jgi:hypothetical protein
LRPVVSAKVAANGNFTLPQVIAGEWRLRIDLPPGSFLKSVRFGEREVRYERFEIEPGSSGPLNIVVGANSAQIHGVIDGGGRTGILLAPSPPYHAVEDLYYSLTSDDTGKFALNGIAPGKYKIYALEKMPAENFRSPTAADQLEAVGEGHAEEIDVAEGASVDVHPKVIPSDRVREALP